MQFRLAVGSSSTTTMVVALVPLLLLLVLVASLAMLPGGRGARAELNYEGWPAEIEILADCEADGCWSVMTKTVWWCQTEVELGEALESLGAVPVPTVATAAEGETPAAKVSFRL